MSDLNLTSHIEDEILWIQLGEPEASIRISSKIGKAFEAMLATAPKGVAVDLSEVDFIDSSFLGTLIATLKDADSRNIKFILYGLRPAVKAIFDLTRLDQIIDIYPDKSGAEDSFKQ